VAESQAANRRDDFEFCEMLTELIYEWNVASKPPKFKATVSAKRDPVTREILEPERAQVYARDSICQFEGKVLKALNDGKAGTEKPEAVEAVTKPGVVDEDGTVSHPVEQGPERYRSGEVEFEVLGRNPGESRPVPLTAWNLMRVQIAITGAVYRQCVDNHQRGVSDEEAGKS
jgi:hypothetical protein